MDEADKLWNDLKGFTPPNCPTCGSKADLDIEGYYCMKCSDPHNPDPAVDDIPNGGEFAELLKQFQKANKDT